MKKIVYTALLLGIIALVVLWRQHETSVSPVIRAMCEGAQSFGCCHMSAVKMLTNNYPQIDSMDAQCPDGMEPNMLKCIDSLRWCE